MKFATKSGTVRPMERSDLEFVLSWRNHPEIRRYMYTQHEVSLPEHQLWFERVANDPEKQVLIFEVEGVPKGFVQFSLNRSAAADWGFYSAPDSGKGTGRLMGATSLDYAFAHLRLHKVCGQALGFNQASIRLHINLGFQREGCLREQQKIGETYHDVVCFGLLAAEWKFTNENIERVSQ